MSNPLISVIIPTFNYAHYIHEALQSVLRQAHSPLEIIIVDDGSTDDTAELLTAYQDRVLYVRQENRGTGAARNTGILRSRGDYLAFLDADDVWIPEKLNLQMQCFRLTPELDAVYGHVEQFVSPDLDARSATRLRHLHGSVQPAPIPSSLLIRRPGFDRVGLFDESLRLGVEMDWYARLQDHGLNSVMLRNVLYRRRLHGSNQNLAYADEQGERLRVLKTVLDRRRKLM